MALGFHQGSSKPLSVCLVLAVVVVALSFTDENKKTGVGGRECVDADVVIRRFLRLRLFRCFRYVCERSGLLLGNVAIDASMVCRVWGKFLCGRVVVSA
jgi:hypothetical protein